MTTFSIRTSSEPQLVTLALGVPTFLVGANGTGKSALIHDVSIQMVGKAEYIPGSRTNIFLHDALTMTPASREQFRKHKVSWDQNDSMRYNPPQWDARNEKAVHDIQADEQQFKIDAANRIAIEGATSSAIGLLQSNNSPFNKLNRLLASASIPIQAILVNGQLQLTRDEITYSFTRSSDGERSALIIISQVLSAIAGTTFIIDEPELHLHRSIVVPLLAGLIGERSDCYFLVSTHELELPISIQNSKCISVRGCTWSGDKVLNWDVDLLPTSDLPEDLRVDVLGSRRRILFVEGTNNSLDQPLYSLLFPQVSVRHKGSCNEVRQAVKGLRATISDHMIMPFGLVDNDQMPQSEIEALRAESVFALTVFTVESLYYSAEMRAALAARQAETLGLGARALLLDAVDRGIAAIKKPGKASQLASRICERTLRGHVLSAIPSREALIVNKTPTIKLEFSSPYPAEFDRLELLIAAADLDAIINRYPVRDTGILDSIAKALHFSSKDDYERAALARVGSDKELAAKLRTKLDFLAQALAS